VALLVRAESDTWRIHDLVGGVTVVEGDLCNLAPVRGRIREFAPTTVLHCGWIGSHRRDRNDARQAATSLRGSLDLLDVAIEAGCSVFVGAGSQAELGPTHDTITGTSPANPDTAYGAAKLSFNMVGSRVASAAGMRFVWLRLLTVFGSADSPEYLIPHVTLELCAQRRPALTFGTQRRDFLHASDAAAAFVLASATDACRGTYVVASGLSPTVREVTEKIRDLIDPHAELGFGELAGAADAQASLLGDPADFMACTGWRPRVSIDEGLRESVDWYRQHYHRYLEGTARW